MSDRYPGGIIVANPTAPTTSSAPGVWTLEQATYYIAQGMWPSQPPPADPYFNYVTMLLTGDGTNGAQNNTFVDSSTNAISITRNNSVTQGSFSPYGSNWGNYFNSDSSEYLSFTSSAFDFSGSSITVEAWVNPSSAPQGSAIISEQFNGGGDTIPFAIAFGSSPGSGSGSNIFVGTYDGSSWIAATGSALTIGVWTHVAGVYSSGTWKLYINGSLVSTSSSVTVPADNDAWYVAKRWDASGSPSYFNGYISNLRVVKSAVYTSNFTPSTTPLTAISNTVLLTCQSNRFIDNSTNNISLTVNGTPSIQRFSAFNPTASYTTTTIGGSGYFDGTDDYLSMANSTGFDIGISSNPFTLELWYYPTSSNQAILFGRGGGFGGWNSTNGWQYTLFTYNGTSEMYMQFWDGATHSDLHGSTPSSYGLKRWNHIAVSYNGTTASLFVNGTRIASMSATFQKPSSSTLTNIGRSVVSSESGYATGYIASCRIVKGTAVYDPTATTLTVPTAPLTAISNTSFLANMVNAGIPDYGMINNLETAGNAQISTSQSKYGTASISLANDSSTAVYWTPTGTTMNFVTGDFTVEFWLYPNGSQIDGAYIISTRASTFSTGTGAWELRFQGTQAVRTQVRPSGGSNDYSINATGSTTITLSAWSHMALVRNGNTLTLYQNGTSIGSNTILSTDSIGVDSKMGLGLGNFAGYIDDLRITNGYARYTANFTPPSQAFYTY